MTDSLHSLTEDPAERSRLLRKAIVLGAGIAGGIAARRLTAMVWQRSPATPGAKPPLTPDDPSVTWRQAVAWAAGSGVAAAFGRLLARRLAAGTV